MWAGGYHYYDTRGRLSRTNSQKKDYAPLMVFDCDGYEPTDFVFSRGWRAVSVTGIVYRDIDFTNGGFKIKEDDTMVGVSGLRCVFKHVNLHSPKKKKKGSGETNAVFLSFNLREKESKVT